MSENVVGMEGESSQDKCEADTTLPVLLLSSSQQKRGALPATCIKFVWIFQWEASILKICKFQNSPFEKIVMVIWYYWDKLDDQRKRGKQLNFMAKESRVW